MKLSQKLWKESLRVIPGGNGLLSKRPDRFSPNNWPIYYSKAKGYNIYDLNNKKYIDFTQMGTGAAILGYADKDVNNFATKEISKSVNTTLNSPLEVALAKELLSINAFAGSVKFSRGGGEAMSIAARIARTYTKKDIVIFSGYHGWQDWYMATNLSSKKNLNTHLLPGLKANGVPKNLINSIIPCSYNNAIELKKLLKKYKKNIAAIIVEGARNTYPSKEFLYEIFQFKKNNKCVFIVDDISSGFRVSRGGSFQKVNYTPDLAVYGKCLGNGFAISAVVGKSNIMDQAQNTFISSSFWTESLGFAAGLAAIKKMKKIRIWQHTNNIGKIYKSYVLDSANRHDIKIFFNDVDAMCSMQFGYSKLNDGIITYITNEMLKRGYLFSTGFYPSYSHNEKAIAKFQFNLDLVFKEIKKKGIDKIYSSLDKKNIRSDAFKRLT